MITVHHLEYSQSFRALWLLEELGVDYALKLYARDRRTSLAPAEYKALSPLGTAPVVTDGDLVLAESGAIIDHFLDAHPQSLLRPRPGDADRGRYLFWFHTAQGSLMPAMLMSGVFRSMETRAPYLFRLTLKPVLTQAAALIVTPRVEAILARAEQDLESAPWFGGATMTAADIMLQYPIEAASLRGYLTDGAHPRTTEWLKRVAETPSFQRALEKSGKSSVVLRIGK